MSLEAIAVRRKCILSCGFRLRTDYRSDRRIGRLLNGINGLLARFLDEEEMYWLGAYPIHFWFVQNIQHGDDDGDYHYLSRDKLEFLLDACERVLEASELERGARETRHSPEYPRGRGQNWVIRNATVAKRYLPYPGKVPDEEYNLDYLVEVERTANWLRLMLAEFWSSSHLYYRAF